MDVLANAFQNMDVKYQIIAIAVVVIVVVMCTMVACRLAAARCCTAHVQLTAAQTCDKAVQVAVQVCTDTPTRRPPRPPPPPPSVLAREATAARLQGVLPLYIQREYIDTRGLLAQPLTDRR